MSAALIFHAVVLFILLQSLTAVLVNLVLFRRPPRGRAEDADSPLVSFLVPARDEEARLPRCLDSLLAQDYQHVEIIVLDDHSSDATAAVARERGFVADASAPRRIITGDALPSGWTGKSWACHQLARAAQGEYLVFVDADTWHECDCVASLIAFARRERADLVALWPRQITESWSEQLVVPLIGLLIMGFMPHVLLWLPQRFPALGRRVPRKWLWALGGACGQFILFRRAAYDAVGGHESVRDHLVEDVELGRRVAERIGEGMRIFNCDGSQLVSCRMYENLAGVWEGFSKNVRAAFDTRVFTFAGFGLMQFVCFLLPFALILLPGWLGPWWKFAAAEVALVLLIRIIITQRLATSWVSVVFHPLAQAFALLIGLNSWRLSSGRGVRWKGRTYRMANP